MNIILLSGGSGKRLWPLSNDRRPKQFIPLFKNEFGDFESMVQRIYRKIKEIDDTVKVTIATSRDQVSMLCNQLGEDIEISIEPERRDTFPAITLAAAYLKDKLGVAKEETVVVCPVDPFVDDGYFTTIKEMGDLVGSETGLVLMGIEPSEPSSKYGYIIPADRNHVSAVKMFKEKPDEKMAEQYIKEGALWNGGVFAFRLGYLLEKAHGLLDFIGYDDLFANYYSMKKISIDYAFVEKERNIRVVRYEGGWRDLGTWDALTEVIGEKQIGRVIVSKESENVHVINELDIPILCMGLKDVVVVAGTDGILISTLEQALHIKSYVEIIEE